MTKAKAKFIQIVIRKQMFFQVRDFFGSKNLKLFEDFDKDIFEYAINLSFEIIKTQKRFESKIMIKHFWEQKLKDIYPTLVGLYMRDTNISKVVKKFFTALDKI